MCPEDAGIEDYRLPIHVVCAAISIPQISVNQDWRDGLEDSERPQKARYHLIVELLAKTVEFSIGAVDSVFAF